LVLVDKELDGSLREFMSTSAAVWNALSQLHDEYLAGIKARPGELPVVTLVKVTERRFGNGSAFEPESQLWTGQTPGGIGPGATPMQSCPETIAAGKRCDRMTKNF
jgi:hypothetical protein